MVCANANLPPPHPHLSVSLSLALSLSVCLSLRLPHHHHPRTHRHEPPQPPTAPSSTLFNVVEGLHFYVLLFQVVRACMHVRACLCVYIAGGGPLCVPLQISRSKRGKHGYINKCSRLTAPVAGTCHSGRISAIDMGWAEGRLSWVKIPTGKRKAAASAACPNDDKGSAGKSHLWRPPVNVDAGRFASSHWHFASLTIPEWFSSEVACTPRWYSSRRPALAAKAKQLFFLPMHRDAYCGLQIPESDFGINIICIVFVEWVKRGRFNLWKSLPWETTDHLRPVSGSLLKTLGWVSVGVRRRPRASNGVFFLKF